MTYTRHLESILSDRLKEKRGFIQALLGPRQVGKTTLIKTVFEQYPGPKLFLSADDPALSGSQDLNEQWKTFRKSTEISQNLAGLLVIDEIHKYLDWEKVVKARWDEDTREKRNIKVVLLGSAPLLIQKGLSESLAGRFEIIDVPHWSYSEVQSAFKLTADEYVFFGSYPGALSLISSEERWKSYIKNSLIETTLSRDILLLTRIDKPALLRRLFLLACEYSGQILSYQKMLGQLQDAGNTTTLAHYLELLSAVGFVKGLSKYTGSKVLTRSSSPKLQVYNTALMSALAPDDYKTIRGSAETWGHWVESAVGAHLLNKSMGTDYQIEYWKEGRFEVDFILRRNKKIVGIEVKSGRKKEAVPGLLELKKQHEVHRTYVVGGQDLPLDQFLKSELADLF